MVVEENTGQVKSSDWDALLLRSEKLVQQVRDGIERTNGRTNGAGNGPDGIRVRLHGIRSPYSLGRLPRPFPRRLPTLGHSPH